MTVHRRLVVLLGVAVTTLVAVVALDRLTRGPSGPRSSSYATVPEGLAAYASLLSRGGHPVTQLRRPPAEVLPDPGGRLVLVDATLTAEDGDALRGWVEAGGTLLVGGARGTSSVAQILPEAPGEHRTAATVARPVGAAAELAGVREVRTQGDGAWGDVGASEPLLTTPEGSVLVAARLGRGRVLALADATPLQNRLLAEADNARLGRGLAGPEGTPVAFVESVHGYGVAEGLAALPERARVALGLLAAAALTLVLARARRLGPAEDAARPLPPPRRLYVESLGAALHRTRDPAGAAVPLQEAARDALAGRLGLRADEPGLRRAAARTGLDALELAAVFEPVTSEDGLVRVAEVRARLTRGGAAAALQEPGRSSEERE